jgi:hypothetical protein
MMKCTLEKFVFALCQCYVSITTTFDLWMNKGALDAFALVINFLTLDWESKHVIISLFEAKGITRINLVSQLQALFEEYKLINKIYYVKHKGTNLSTIKKGS